MHGFCSLIMEKTPTSQSNISLMAPEIQSAPVSREMGRIKEWNCRSVLNVDDLSKIGLHKLSEDLSLTPEFSLYLRQYAWQIFSALHSIFILMLILSGSILFIFEQLNIDLFSWSTKQICDLLSPFFRQLSLLTPVGKDGFCIRLRRCDFQAEIFACKPWSSPFS